MTATDAERLFADHQHLVLIVARRLAKRLPWRIDPDELYTAGLSGLWRAAQRFEPARGSKFWTYAERCIRGEILDWLRIDSRSRRKVEWPCPLPDDFDVPGPAGMSELSLEFRDLIETALRGLWTWRQRRAVQLHFLEGFTHRMIARRFGCTECNVSWMLKRAYAHMRKQLKKEVPWTD